MSRPLAAQAKRRADDASWRSDATNRVGWYRDGVAARDRRGTRVAALIAQILREDESFNG